MEELEKLQPGIIDGVGTVMITEKESNVPHFTIIRDDGSEVSIMIEENRYLNDDGTLTIQECEKLNDWARGYRESSPFKDPNWDHIIICWNGLYNGYEIDTDIDGLYLNNIPDYTHIKPCE